LRDFVIFCTCLIEKDGSIFIIKKDIAVKKQRTSNCFVVLLKVEGVAR